MRTILKLKGGLEMFSNDVATYPLPNVQITHPLCLEYDLSGGPSSFVNEPAEPRPDNVVYGKVEQMPDLDDLGTVEILGEDYNPWKEIEDLFIRGLRDVTPGKEDVSNFGPMPFFTKRPLELTEEQKFIQTVEFVDAWYDKAQNQYWKVEVIRRPYDPNKYLLTQIPEARYNCVRVMKAVEAMAFVEGFEKLVGPDVLKGVEL